MSAPIDQAHQGMVSALPDGKSTNQAILIWQALALAIVIGVIYYGIGSALAADWWANPNFSHGFFVPPFSIFVAWQRRKSLAALPLRPSWIGLLIIAGALGVLVVGVLGAELFLSRSSLVLLLCGMIVYFAGWRHFRVLFFPWAVLFLMIPIPVIIFNQITLPLQFLASRLAAGLLGLVGVPVLREGNVINLPSMSLEVVEACSGIRSLVTLVTLAVIYGYFMEKRYLWRFVLMIAAIPIAVLANGMRIMGAGLLGQYASPDYAEGFFHLFSGWLIFVLSLAMLFLLNRVLNLLPRMVKGSELAR